MWKFKSKRKTTIKDLQRLAGHLKFINPAVVPGRAFTRRMYAKFTGNNILDNKGRILKPRHHVMLDLKFCLDCVMWENFLTDLQSIVWPFVDMQESVEANTLNFFTDAAAREGLAYGAIFGDKWLFGQWEKDFVKKCKHSIAFLELFALCAGIMTWAEWITKIRICYLL